MGEGAYYAPDLTKITKQRGEAYLTAFLRDPSQFYSEEEHRRLMPDPDLNDEEIAHVIAFLDWVSNIDTQGWPPRPILVSGSAIPGLARLTPTDPDAPASTEPVALGESLFRSAELSCFACHSLVPGVNLAGPTLAGMKTLAAERLADPAYAGKATDAAGYVRESILRPSAYLVPGQLYASDGVSMMPSHFVNTLQPGQVDDLVAYLLSLE